MAIIQRSPGGYFTILVNQLIRRENAPPNRSWRVDETMCAWLAAGPIYTGRFDSAGTTIEFLLSPHRDLHAAKGFLRLALSAGQVCPQVINVDCHPAYASAMNELKDDGELSRRCQCRPHAIFAVSAITTPQNQLCR
jgi:transposase-like protein